MANANIELIREIVAGSGLDAATIDEQRAGMEATAGAIPPSDGVTVEPTTVAGRPAEWIAPRDGASDRVVLYLHGGGYCIGSIRTHRNLASRLALAYGGRVLNLDYRLAPEHPFPAAIDDVLGAYGELLDAGRSPGQIAIAGDSAGGGLTVASLVAIRQQGLPFPAAGVCLSPWVDLTQSSATYVSRADVDPMVTKAGLDVMAAAYLGVATLNEPLASPLFADLTGLPPLLVQVGDAEVLLDDSLALRDTARAAGVDVTFDLWPEMIHVVQAFPPELLPESDLSIGKVAAFLQDRLT
ncbi:MAG: alpha/beta hydrolase [Acidimicrobiales bacterium]